MSSPAPVVTGGGRAPSGDAAVVVASNRGPLAFGRDDAGRLVVRRGAGGLVVTLGPGVLRDGARWIGSALNEEDREAAAAGVVDADGFHLQPLVIDPDDYRAYYDVVANSALWYCLHGLWDRPRRPRFDRRWRQAWDAYRRVNHAYAAAVAASVAPGGTVLIQDYHLTLVGAELARLRPDVHSCLFMHTPWCGPDELAALPDDVVVELLTGMAGAGAVGFHSRRWADRFDACCELVLGRRPATFVAPATTDLEDLTAVAASARCVAEGRQLAEEVGGRRFIVRVDRIEPSKNVLRGFWAFDELLAERPDLRGAVTFGAFVYPSRQGLAEYQAYGQEVVGLVRMLNERWGTSDWTPILLDTDDHYARSVAALRSFDALLVNPVRDGLNLVAKEGALVNERDGGVVLSREAGCYDEMAGLVEAVNPFDVSATAAALAAVLDMPTDQRHQRAVALRKRLADRTPLQWWDQLRAGARAPV